jgi:hypothetical protein
VKVVLSPGGIFEAYLGNGFYLVRGTEGSDLRRTKALARRLIDWTAAGYDLVYYANGDIAVLVESRDGVPRDRIIYTAPGAFNPRESSNPPRRTGTSPVRRGGR